MLRFNCLENLTFGYAISSVFGNLHDPIPLSKLSSYVASSKLLASIVKSPVLTEYTLILLDFKIL
jgi:hypothetical protein